MCYLCSCRNGKDLAYHWHWVPWWSRSGGLLRATSWRPLCLLLLWYAITCQLQSQRMDGEYEYVGQKERSWKKLLCSWR